MSATKRITIRISEEGRDKLVQLADFLGRTRSSIARQALVAYVDREMAILNGIKEGLADVSVGKSETHGAAMAELRSAIQGASISAYRISP